jgi:ElaB/YqjD/DUF883 family membrane-anchored ribosome-binding protein
LEFSEDVQNVLDEVDNLLNSSAGDDKDGLENLDDLIGN